MAWTREQLAERAAKELQDGFYVNLGIRRGIVGCGWRVNGYVLSLGAVRSMH